MKYFYSVIIIGLILIIWFAPIDMEREKQLPSSGPRMIVSYIMGSTWLKIALTVLLGFVFVGLHNENKTNDEY
jgi:hypothetical protein